MVKEKFRYLLFFGTIVNILLSAWWVINSNIFFHTDIARDFLLLEDIVVNKLALIGPRSGAVPGVFHGPLWLYLNLPAFYLGNGNPVVVGWFWVILSIISLVIVYLTGKKLFDKEVGLLSVLLLSAVTIVSIRNLFNPFGALMLAPLFFYLFCKYLEKPRIKTLVYCLLTLGLIIQFQMAFGVPILILTFFYVLIFAVRKKKKTNLLAFAVLLLPLSTFIFFDLRHDFIQLTSALSYVSGVQNHGKMTLSFTELISLRVKEAFIDGFGLAGGSRWKIVMALLLPVTLTVYSLFKKRKLSFNSPYVLFFYFYFGFWIISLAFKGPMWSYYYWPFLSLIVLIFCSTYRTVSKFIFYPVFVLLLVFNLWAGITDMLSYRGNLESQDVSTWKFNLQVAKDVYADSGGEFGYYIFTPDLYGYSPRYAMDYYQRLDPVIKSYPYQKKAVTYLLIAPPPEYGRDPNSIWAQKNTNSSLWKSGDVRINKEPVKVVTYKNDFRVEKYNLTAEELQLPSNPYLIQSIFFR